MAACFILGACIQSLYVNLFSNLKSPFPKRDQYPNQIKRICVILVYSISVSFACLHSGQKLILILLSDILHWVVTVPCWKFGKKLRLAKEKACRPFFLDFIFGCSPPPTPTICPKCHCELLRLPSILWQTQNRCTAEKKILCIVPLLPFFGKKGLFLRSAKGRESNLVQPLASDTFATLEKKQSFSAIARH